ncbi:hypothetical protein DFH08DRAFT_843727 [Mycena albidolilacea]|uniref:Secreted protein n=1 Tax=Mycena albidolilacea TaxID=1033008 RepID=A0AAD7AKH9_9AGAR|nr:hypothetical protein DFH08DRAFT_843727 [Mycena albidolilacea]
MPTIACLVLFLLWGSSLFSWTLCFLIVATCVWDETKEGVDAIRTTSEIEVGVSLSKATGRSQTEGGVSRAGQLSPDPFLPPRKHNEATHIILVKIYLWARNIRSHTPF